MMEMWICQLMKMILCCNVLLIFVCLLLHEYKDIDNIVMYTEFVDICHLDYYLLKIIWKINDHF